MSEEKRVVDWSAIRRDYEHGASLRALSATYGVAKSVIGERKYKEQWEQSRTESRTDSNSQRVIVRDANAAVRVSQALDLRAKKHTYEHIAQQCGYASEGAARNAVQRELQRVVVTNVEQLRHEELLALDILQQECMTLFLDTANKGRLFAADRLLVIMERRAKLMALDQTKDAIATAQVVVRGMPPGYLGEATS